MHLLPAINYISGTLSVLALIIVLGSVLIKKDVLIKEIKEIPRSFIVAGLGLLLWFVFLVEKSFSGRQDMGVWLFSLPNMDSWIQLLPEIRAPVYFWRSKALIEIFDGISYEFLAVISFATFIVSIFLVYLTIKNITENKSAAYLSSLFYAFYPITFVYSMTEDYVLLAVFFGIISLFFASLWVKKRDESYLFPMAASALLSAASRVDYVFFPYLIIFLYILLSENRKDSKFWKTALVFIVFFIPRTLSSLGMYLDAAQHDPGLTENLIEYTGNPFSYAVEIAGGFFGSFVINLQNSLRAYLNTSDLSLIFVILGFLSLILIFKKVDKKSKKLVFFLLFQFLFLFIYYNFLHPTGGATAPRYQITVMFPLLLLSGIFIGFIFEGREYFSYLISSALLIFSFIFLIFPLTFRSYVNLLPDNSLKFDIAYYDENLFREYDKYRELSYENRISRIAKSEFDVFKEENTYFLINGDRTFLHSMPINGTFVPIFENQELEEFYEKAESGALIYVTQSEIGFTIHHVDGYSPINPEKFKEKVLDLFELEEVLIDYEIDEHNAFLMRVRK